MLERDGQGQWSQRAYVKASNNTEQYFSGEFFGHSVALSGDGGTVAVGAWRKANDVGAVYLY